MVNLISDFGLRGGSSFYRDTLAARGGLEEYVRVSLIFEIIVSFMLFTVFMYLILKNF
jgi:hypothetical protein